MATSATPNAYQPRDPDHEGHLLLENSNRTALVDARAVGHPADDHGVTMTAYVGKWRIIPGTDLEMLVTDTGTVDDDDYVQIAYRLRRDVPLSHRDAVDAAARNSGKGQASPEAVAELNRRLAALEDDQ